MLSVFPIMYRTDKGISYVGYGFFCSFDRRRIKGVFLETFLGRESGLLDSWRIAVEEIVEARFDVGEKLVGLLDLGHVGFEGVGAGVVARSPVTCAHSNVVLYLIL